MTDVTALPAGAHSWVRKTLSIGLDGEQTDYIWGVVDMVPETDFPDIRNRTAVHSNNGSCMVIPREGDLVRLYIQLADRDVVDPATGRVDKSKMGPEQLLDVAKKSFAPFQISNADGHFDWWTLYISEYMRAVHRWSGWQADGRDSWTAGRDPVLGA